MARRTTATRPTPLRAPRIPQVGRLRRKTEWQGEEVRPFAGPEIPLPPDQDEALLARWEAWQAQTSGSLPEFIVWEWLIGKKRQIPGVDFLYQHPVFGGRTQFGGYMLDFFFPQMKMGWRVMGLRWHRTKPEDRARDAVAKQLLASEGKGMVVIDLWEDDIFARPDFVLDKAWRGEQANTARAV